jgi:hypothetical protein
MFDTCFLFSGIQICVFSIVHLQVWDVDVKIILAALAWKCMFGEFVQPRPERLNKKNWHVIVKALDGQPRNGSKCHPGMPSQEGLICLSPRPEIIKN